VEAEDVNVLNINVVNLHDWLFKYKYFSVFNNASRNEGLWGLEGKAPLIFNLDT
jgi:hypothetical protein